MPLDAQVVKCCDGVFSDDASLNQHMQQIHRLCPTEYSKLPRSRVNCLLIKVVSKGLPTANQSNNTILTDHNYSCANSEALSNKSVLSSTPSLVVANQLSITNGQAIIPPETASTSEPAHLSIMSRFASAQVRPTGHPHLNKNISHRHLPSSLHDQLLEKQQLKTMGKNARDYEEEKEVDYSALSVNDLLAKIGFKNLPNKRALSMSTNSQTDVSGRTDQSLDQFKTGLNTTDCFSLKTSSLVLKTLPEKPAQSSSTKDSGFPSDLSSISTVSRELSTDLMDTSSSANMAVNDISSSSGDFCMSQCSRDSSWATSSFDSSCLDSSRKINPAKKSKLLFKRNLHFDTSTTNSEFGSDNDYDTETADEDENSSGNDWGQDFSLKENIKQIEVMDKECAMEVAANEKQLDKKENDKEERMEVEEKSHDEGDGMSKKDDDEKNSDTEVEEEYSEEDEESRMDSDANTENEEVEEEEEREGSLNIPSTDQSGQYRPIKGDYQLPDLLLEEKLSFCSLQQKQEAAHKLADQLTHLYFSVPRRSIIQATTFAVIKYPALSDQKGIFGTTLLESLVVKRLNELKSCQKTVGPLVITLD